MKALLANLGFVLQLSGIFIAVPIILSFYFNETDAIIALFLTAMIFQIVGFFLNALCVRRELNYKQSCALFAIVFIVLSFIGSIPYLNFFISDTGDVFQGVTNSVFESASGFTTTGFTMLTNLSIIPKSIIFYRSLTQFIGGIGIVLILLAFFYPEAKLKGISNVLGIAKNQKIKKTFILIISVYCAYAFIMIISGLIFGYRDIVNLSAFVFSALSTGGFAPISDITAAVTQFPLNFIVIITMVLGSVNFLIVAGLFKRKFKEFFLSEFSVFIPIVLISILITTIFFKLSLFDSVFHVISASSTAGFKYIPVFSDNVKFLFILLMFIGGSSLSTAGGIKIFRLVLMIKATKKVIAERITQQKSKLKLFGKEYTNAEIIQSLTIILLMASVVIISSFILSLYGFKPLDAVFEITSGIVNCGLSTGLVSPSLVFELKWFFIAIMILGRVEILAFLIIFSRKKEPEFVNGCKQTQN